MKFFRKIANTVLRLLQNAALYRRLGRRSISAIALHEATDADRLAVQRWLNPNGDPAQGASRNPNTTDWIAKNRGQIAGFVQLVRNPPESAGYSGYWLFSLYVKPRWQGLGIGELLSQAVVECARMENAPVLNLVVYNDNTRAARLYKKLGFEMSAIPELEPLFESEFAKSGRRQVVMRKLLSNHP